MRSKLLPTLLGCLGLVLVVPVLVAMGFVVANERHTGPPTGPSAIEGVITSPNVAQGPIGAPFVYAKVRVYATYHRGGRQMYGSVSYIDEHRGNPRVTLSTSSGPVEVELKDPMNTWRNAAPESVAYDSPAQVPGWQPQWQPPSNVRQYVAYVLAVRSGQTLLVERGADGTAGVAWIGGRAQAEAAMSRGADAQRAFSLGSFAAAGVCGLVSIVLVAIGLLRRKQS